MVWIEMEGRYKYKDIKGIRMATCTPINIDYAMLYSDTLMKSVNDRGILKDNTNE